MFKDILAGWKNRQLFEKLHKSETGNTHTNPASCRHLCLPEFSDTLWPVPTLLMYELRGSPAHIGWEIE